MQYHLHGFTPGDPAVLPVAPDVEDGLSEFPHTILSQARIHDFYLETMQRSPRRLVPDYGRRFTGFTVTNAGPFGDASGQLDPRAGRSGPRGRDRNGAVSLSRRLRRGAEFGSHVARCRAPRGCGQQELGCHGRAGGHGLPGHPSQSGDPVGARWKCARHPLRGRIPRAHVHGAGRARARGKGRRSRHLAGRSPQRGATSSPPVHPRREGGRLVVDVRDRSAPHRYVRRCLDRRCRPRRAARVHHRRCLPHPQPEGRTGHDFDREMEKLFSARAGAAGGSVDDEGQQAKFQRYFTQHARFTAGVETRYEPSLITHAAPHRHLATGLTIGKRFHSHAVVRLGDARPVHLGHTMKADGRWRIFAFADADDPTHTSSRLAELCAFLESGPHSRVLRSTPPDADLDAVIDVRAVCQQFHRDLALDAMPPAAEGPLTGSSTTRRSSAPTCTAARTSSTAAVSIVPTAAGSWSDPTGTSLTSFRSTTTRVSPRSSRAS